MKHGKSIAGRDYGSFGTSQRIRNDSPEFLGIMSIEIYVEYGKVCNQISKNKETGNNW